MNSENFLESFMSQISQELGRPYSSFAPYTQLLADNWLDTKEALMQADQQIIDSLNMPAMLKQKLKEKIAQLKNQKANQHNYDPSFDIEENANTYKPYSSAQPNLRQQTASTKLSATPGLREEIEANLNNMYQTIMGKENLIETLKIMDKLIANIVNNPTEQKFRTINLENDKIRRTIGSSHSAKAIFQSLLFVHSMQGTQQLQLESVSGNTIENLKLGLEMIHSFGENIVLQANKIGVSHVGSMTGKTNLTVAKVNASDISDIYDQVTRLKWERDQMIPLKPKDRQFKIITQVDLDYEKKIVEARFGQTGTRIGDGSTVGGKMEEEEIEDEPNAKWLLSGAARSNALQNLLSEPKFSNKKKEELERLISTPVFIEATIRFLLPNGTIFQANFSPKETVKDMRETIEPYLDMQQSWYLYTCPPVQKLELKKFEGKTLQDLELVPRAKVYIGIN